MNFDLTKTTDSTGVRYELAGRGNPWQVALAKRIAKDLVGGRRDFSGGFEWYHNGTLHFRAHHDFPRQPLQGLRFEFYSEHRTLREGICEAVEAHLRMLERRVTRRLAFYEPLVDALDEIVFKPISARLSDLEQEDKRIERRLDELERHLSGMDHRLIALEDVQERVNLTAAGADYLDGRSSPFDGDARLIRNGASRGPSLYERFARVFGVTPGCEACGGGNDVRAGICVACRAEAAGERIEYGAAS